MARPLSTAGIALALVAASCGHFESEETLTPGLNAVPTIDVLTPSTDVAILQGQTLTIEFVDDDDDDIAFTTIYAVPAVTDPNDSDPGDPYEIEIETGILEQDGALQQLSWDTTGVPWGAYRILGSTSDEIETATDFSDGTVTILPPGAGPEEVSLLGGEGTLVFESEAWPDGSHAVLGTYSQSLTLEPGEPDELTLASLYDTDELFVARYDANGALLWARTTQSHGAPDPGIQPNFGERQYGLSALPDGGLAIGASYRYAFTLGMGEPGEAALPAPANGSNNFVARLDPDGSLAWAASIESSVDVALNGIDRWSDGAVIVCGSFNGTVDFGPLQLATTEEESSYVARFSATGALEWARRIESGTDAYALMAATHEDRYAVLGQFQGAATFGPGASAQFVDPPAGPGATYLAVFASDGTLDSLAYAYCDNGASPLDLVERNGDFAIYGFRVDDLGIVTENGQEGFLPANGDLGFLARIDSDGSLDWVKSVPAHFDQPAQDVLTKVQGDGFAIAGRLSETTVFGPGEPNESTLAPFGGANLFYARYGDNGEFYQAEQDGGFGNLMAVTATAIPGDNRLVVGVRAFSTGTLGFDTQLEDVTVDPAITPAAVVIYPIQAD